MTRESFGPLPEYYRDRLDFDRLHGFVERALLGQSPAIRNPLLEYARDHELEVTPFDADGFLVVSIQGAQVLRLHWTRLMTGASMDPS